MNDDKLRSVVPVSDTVDLSPLGYDSPSAAEVYTNPTRAWRVRWFELTDARPGEGEEPSAFEERQTSAFCEIVPYVVRRVVLVRGDKREEYDIQGPEEARRLYAADSRVLDLCVTEAYERGRAQMVMARVAFRDERIARLANLGAPNPVKAEASEGAA